MTKTIFITGGSRGIGEALVRLCAGKYNVAFTYNENRERAEALEKELSSFGGVKAIRLDVRDKNSVFTALDTAKSRFGKIDALVNNAGVSLDKIFIDSSPEDIAECFSVNVFGLMSVTQAVLPEMLSRGSGCIVNVSSIWGRVGASGETVYSASKAAVLGFTKALAKEVAPMGVRVNAVAPGAIDTDMMKVYSASEIESLCRDSIPLGRLGKPEEVAQAILFLIDNEYITGECLSVTGLLR